MKLFGIVIAAIAVMGASGAHAREWVLVSVGENAATAINRSSIRDTSAGKQAWFAIIFSRTTDSGTDYALIQRVFDCDRERSATTMAAMYSAEGTNLASAPRSDPMTPVIIDSVEYGMLAAACRGVLMIEDEEGWAGVPEMLVDYRTSNDRQN